jgi:hypothetical protein
MEQPMIKAKDCTTTTPSRRGLLLGPEEIGAALIEDLIAMGT